MIGGDGCFSITNRKGFPLRFSIAQANTEIKVIEAIQKYLLELPGKYYIKSTKSNPVSLRLPPLAGREQKAPIPQSKSVNLN